MSEVIPPIVFYGLWAIMVGIGLILSLRIPAALVAGLVFLVRDMERRSLEQDPRHSSARPE